MDMPPTVNSMTGTLPDTATAQALTGQMIIAGTPVRGTGEEIRGFDPAAGQPLEPVYRTATPPTSTPPAPPPPRRSPPTAPPPPSSAPSSSKRSPPTSRPSASRSSPAPSPRAACRRHASPARSAAPPGSFGCSPPCCARAAGTAPASTPRFPIAPRCRAPTSASASSRSARSRCSAPPTSRSRSPSPAATPPRRSPPAAPSSSRAHDAHPGTSELVARAISDAVAETGHARWHLLAAVRLRPRTRHRARHRPAHQGRRLHRITFRRNRSGRRRRRSARADPGLRRDELDQPGVPARRRAEHPRRRPRHARSSDR